MASRGIAATVVFSGIGDFATTEGQFDVFSKLWEKLTECSSSSLRPQVLKFNLGMVNLALRRGKPVQKVVCLLNVFVGHCERW